MAHLMRISLSEGVRMGRGGVLLIANQYKSLDICILMNMNMKETEF